MAGAVGRIRWIIALVAAAVLGAILIACLTWLPWRSHVQTSGVVIDGVSGLPIENARVIVTLVRNGFPYSSYMGYGTVTDSNGRFSLNIVTPRRFNYAFVEASAPNDDYGAVTPAEGDVTVTVAPLPEIKRRSPRLHYDQFGGAAGFNHARPLMFVGGGW
jgi:hypothetical protein